MAVTSHAYPVTIHKVNSKLLDLTVTTALAYQVGLCTGDASAWTSTQEAYAFVHDVTNAYTEVTGGGYARVDISSGVTLTRTNNVDVWTCTSPISFGSSVTITARSMFIYTTLIGSGDTTYPVLGIVDFGANVISTAGAFTYTVDSVNGLLYWTSS